MDPSTEHLDMSLENPNLRRYIFNSIKPYIKGSILDIGSGLGAYRDLLRTAGTGLILSDINPEYVVYLRKTYPDDAVLKLNIEKEFLAVKFDTIILNNVLEHIAQDINVLSNCEKMLLPEGRLIFIVPAYEDLMTTTDEAIGHFRRYDDSFFRILAPYYNLRVVKTFHINSLGVVGWFVNGVQMRTTINRKLLKLYDNLIPIVRVIDWLFFRKVGLSLVVVMERRGVQNVV